MIFSQRESSIRANMKVENILWASLEFYKPKGNEAVDFINLVNGVKYVLEYGKEIVISEAVLDGERREQLPEWRLQVRKAIFNMIGKEEEGTVERTPGGAETGYQTAFKGVWVVKQETSNGVKWYLQNTGIRLSTANE